MSLVHKNIIGMLLHVITFLKINLGDIVFQVPGGGAQVSNTIPSQPNSLIPELTLLSLLEQEARCVASSVDGLTEHLAASLHTVCSNPV